VELALDPAELVVLCVEGGGPVTYRLLAFMHDRGRWAKYGHDISFVRFGEQWIKFNDAVATAVDDIATEVPFGQQYLYLWERNAI
jgi:ubiquitin C-terminal hydrolase